MKTKWKVISPHNSWHSLLHSLLWLICSPKHSQCPPFVLLQAGTPHNCLPKELRAAFSWAPAAGQKVAGKTGNRGKSLSQGTSEDEVTPQSLCAFTFPTLARGHLQNKQWCPWRAWSQHSWKDSKEMGLYWLCHTNLPCPLHRQYIETVTTIQLFKKHSASTPEMLWQGGSGRTEALIVRES